MWRWSVCPGKDKFGGFPRIVPLGQALPLQNVTAGHAPLGWPFPPHPLLAGRQQRQSVVAAWEMNFCPTQMGTSRQQGPNSGGCPSSYHLTPVVPASCALDSPGISPCRTAFTGSVPRNEAKLGPGCKQRAAGAPCAHMGDATLNCHSWAKIVPKTPFSDASPLSLMRGTEGALSGSRFPPEPNLGLHCN